MRSALAWGTGSNIYPAPVEPVVRAGVQSRFADRSGLAAIAIADFYGIDGEMLPVTRAEAMSVPAMARARTIVCTTIGRAPLEVHSDPRPLGAAVIPGDTYPHDELIRQPEVSRPRYATLVDTADSLLFSGVALWHVVDRYAPSTNGGRPRRVEYVRLDRVTFDDKRDRWLIDDQPVDRADLLWFEGPHEGVLNFAGRALRAAVKLDRSANAQAANPVPAVELHQLTGDPLSDAEIDDLTGAWETALAGKGVAYTNEAVEVRTHGATAEQLLISGRNAAAVEIARTVGVPATAVDAVVPGSSMTYVNAQARSRELIDFGVAAYAEAITARLSLDDVLPRGVTVSFNYDPMVRESFSDRMAGYATAAAAGVYTVDELRMLETGRPLEETPNASAG